VRYWLENSQFRNVAGYYNADIDSLMQQARAESDVAARTDIFHQLQLKLTEEAPWIWLYTANAYVAYQPNVSGYEGYPTGSLISLAHVTVDRSA
jgi:peptide/nickel transport system substrate-binding protein